MAVFNPAIKLPQWTGAFFYAFAGCNVEGPLVLRAGQARS